MKQDYEYDAFVIYSPTDDDLKFVKKMANILEAPPLCLRLFIPWRDSVDGETDHYITADLIENRCRKCIVVVSNNFSKSEVAEFQLKHAHCISPGYRNRKILPIRLDDCEIPPVLKQLSFLDYQITDIRKWFWKRLQAAFRVDECEPKPLKSSNDSMLPDIVLDTSSKRIREFWISSDSVK